jgi:hypothetical protein
MQNSCSHCKEGGAASKLREGNEIQKRPEVGSATGDVISEGEDRTHE